MGQFQYNLSTNTDYATPEKDTVIELHMALPIPYDDLLKVQNWFDQNDWTAVRQYLTAKYPEHRQCLENWMAGSEARSRGKAKQKLAIAG
ncbi:hypothetical protein ACQUJT_18230 [Ralstonia pseudosolanacearum]